MHIRRFFTALCLIGSFGLGLSMTSTAQGQAPLNIGILDLAAIRKHSVAIKDIRAQVEKYRKGFQAEIKKEEDALQVANQDLAKKRTLLGPEAFAKERRQFEQKVVGVQKLVRQRKAELDRAFSKAMLIVEDKMNTIMSEVATKRGARVVLRRQHTVLSDRSLDMTQEVLKRLNAELKTVPVKKPGSK